MTKDFKKLSGLREEFALPYGVESVIKCIFLYLLAYLLTYLLTYMYLLIHIHIHSCPHDNPNSLSLLFLAVPKLLKNRWMLLVGLIFLRRFSVEIFFTPLHHEQLNPAVARLFRHVARKTIMTTTKAPIGQSNEYLKNKTNCITVIVYILFFTYLHITETAHRGPQSSARPAISEVSYYT